MLRNVARTYRALDNPTTGVSLASDFGPSAVLGNRVQEPAFRDRDSGLEHLGYGRVASDRPHARIFGQRELASKRQSGRTSMFEPVPAGADTVDGERQETSITRW